MSRSLKASLLLGAFSLSSIASAEALTSRVAEAVSTWFTGAALESYGQSGPKMIRGRDAAVAISKAGRLIKWGGAVTLGAGLVNDAMHWYMKEASSAMYPDVKNWWDRPPPSNSSYPPKQGYWELVSPICSSATGVLYGMYKVNAGGGTEQYGIFNEKPEGGWTYSTPQEAKCGAELLLHEVPGGYAALRAAVAEYLPTHPEVLKPLLEPAPNTNQMDDYVTDPGLDTDGDGQTDGDELRQGISTNGGNRPHGGDGELSDPNDPNSRSLDTDGDGIPDWRDSDDDNDGTPDNNEPTQPQGCQKDPACNPESERDTDGDGVPDRSDPDDDGDGWPDDEEEREGTNPKDAGDKPRDTDGDGVPDSRDPDDDGDGASDEEELAAGSDPKNPGDKPQDTDGDGVPDWRDPDDDGDGASDEEELAAGTDPKNPVDKPLPKDPPDPCKANPSAEGCGPPDPCKANPDAEGCKPPPDCKTNPDAEGCEPPDPCKDNPNAEGCKPEDPPENDCGVFSIKRLLVHTGSYLKDVVFPCESDYGWITEIKEAASVKFPFSMVTRLDNMVTYGGGSDSSSALPNKLGPFNLDWSAVASLITVAGLLFKSFISWIAVDIILSRLSGQLVIK